MLARGDRPAMNAIATEVDPKGWFDGRSPDNGVRLDDHQRRAPLLPDSHQGRASLVLEPAIRRREIERRGGGRIEEQHVIA